MPVIIPDETLRQANLTEQQARIEIACRLFEAGVLALSPAAKLAHSSRDEFLAQLQERGIPAYRPTSKELQQDLANLDRLVKE